MRHPGTQNILTPRLLLRRAAPADAENCALHWASDPLVYRHISATPKTQREMEVFLASVEAAYADPATYYWLIQLRSSPDIIGALFVDDLSERSRWCEVDYQLSSAY